MRGAWLLFPIDLNASLPSPLRLHRARNNKQEHMSATKSSIATVTQHQNGGSELGSGRDQLAGRFRDIPWAR